MPQSISGGYKPLANPTLVDKEQVVRWLLDAEESELRWVWAKAAERLNSVIPDLNASSVPSRKSMLHARNSLSAAPPDEAEKDEGNGGSSGQRLPVVQFSSPIYFVDEVEGMIDLDIIRIGDKSGETVVSFQTEDDSAVAGEDYVTNSGTITFKPGEGTKSITVEVLPSSMWKTTSDFKVVLLDKNLSGAVLGEYLFTARVKLIDNTTFPSDEFKSVDWMDDEAEVPRLQLLIEYCKMNFQIPNVGSATLKYVLVDWFHILTETLELFMSVYLLDFILSPQRPESDLLLIHNRHESLLLLAAVRLVLFLVAYFLDYSRLSFGLIGTSKLYLKGGLLRTYLNYTKDVREKLYPGDVLMAMERDIDRIIDEGYVNLLRLAHLFGNLVSKVAFMLVSPMIIGEHPPHLRSVSCLFGLPGVLTFFLYIRYETVHKFLEIRQHLETDVSNNVTLTAMCSDLIFGYSLRNFVQSRFTTIARKCNAAKTSCNQMMMNNSYFGKWATFMSISIYTFYGGIRVINGDLSVGVFVANLSVFQSLGDNFIEMYDVMASVQRILPSMLFVARLLNFSTEIALRKESQEQKRQSTENLRSAVVATGDEHKPRIDQLPITLDLEKFRFQKNSIGTEINFAGNIAIKQGQLVAVIGDKGSGKSTLLRLISNTLLSETTVRTVFVPAHLRLVNVADHVVFISGTLKQNLTFGINEGSRDIRDDRILGICKEFLQMDDRVLGYLQEDHEHKWNEMFSGAQCRLLMIARALIFNAELTTVHKPLNGLSPSQIEHVLDSFKQHVAQKGLFQESKVEQRRPRTLIFSSNHDSSILENQANYIIDISPQGMHAK